MMHLLMADGTKDQLVTVAAALLDGGGVGAVTLRAVGGMAGVSYNAPYRHFRSRSALLAAVAERDFHHLLRAFELARAEPDAGAALRDAAGALIDYAERHPARYRLLFSDPELEAELVLREAAAAPFQAFAAIVARCQQEQLLPSGDPIAITGLIYAALHGSIDLRLGGRGGDAKGLGSVRTTVELLFELLRQRCQ